MLDRFLSYIEEKKLLPQAGTALVAASAGVDSSVLCHLFHRAGLPFAVGHCNFQLRGLASDGDADFCQQLAQQFGVPFHGARFDTVAFAEKNKVGIQEAARTLRYGWLEKTAQAAGYQYIATAHHADDNIETVLFNFAKGTGIRGMRGIPVQRGIIIRPVLFATKRELLEFAEQEKIGYREDESNLTDQYTRNQLRHLVVPALEKLVPGFQQNAHATIGRLTATEELFHFAIGKIRLATVQETAREVCIDLPKLRSYPAPATVLYELLRPFRFSAGQVESILQIPDSQSGSQFESPSHRLLVDRFLLIIRAKETTDELVFSIDKKTASLALPHGQLQFRQTDKVPSSFPEDNEVAWFDFDCLQWPLTLRHWQPGDRFQPLGMGGHHKKLQDLFTDEKLSRFDKEGVWVLESGGEICWVVGLRTGERCKVRPSTKTCLVVERRPGFE